MYAFMASKATQKKIGQSCVLAENYYLVLVRGTLQDPGLNLYQIFIFFIGILP